MFVKESETQPSKTGKKGGVSTRDNVARTCGDGKEKKRKLT